jgi:hypothetical protein
VSAGLTHEKPQNTGLKGASCASSLLTQLTYFRPTLHPALAVHHLPLRQQRRNPRRVPPRRAVAKAHAGRARRQYLASASRRRYMVIHRVRKRTATWCYRP